MNELDLPYTLGRSKGPAGLKLARLQLVPKTMLTWRDQAKGWMEIKEGGRLVEVDVATTSSSFLEDSTPDANGLAYSYGFNFSLKRVRVETLQFIARHIRQGWVVIFQTVAGDCRLVGSLEFPLLMRAAAQMGGGVNSTTFSLTGLSPIQAPFVDAMGETALHSFSTYDSMTNLSSSNTAVYVEFETRRGDTFYRRLAFSKAGADESLEGSSFKMQIKKYFTDEVLLELTHQNYLLIEGNLIQIEIPASKMKDLPLGEYRFDLEQTKGTLVKTRMEGTFIVTPDITHD
ncbi:hypothetical protein [Siphonobacter sp. SORGH_AS_1065]|uniref:hypothetical protein n=1 Tax=Siphonobacter sp. SORGH_AS_1065 TaxID=3041795 RepID=UPI002782FEB5|nr:hypothetical protein [Siphonobacter sp. SORGH_AS_1065]MDQ1085642.1 hypothetical protein [Siphonobacter sp. SORGH_AS_1065]